MNWDWDKLQEKRRHQGAPQGNGNQNEDRNRSYEDDNDYQHQQQQQRKPSNQDDEDDFFAQAAKKRQNQRNKQPFNNNDPRKMLEQFNMPGAKWIALLLLVVWFGSGIFIVRPDEAGVVLRFGAYNRTVNEGLHYHLPYPIETVSLPKVTQIRQITVGLPPTQSSSMFSRSSVNASSSHDEAAMLTGDENIVNIQFSIQYYIKPDGVVDYLYKVAEPDAVVKKAAEAAMREVIGKTTLDNALTVGRSQIQDQVADLLQSILDSYQVGIQVVAVQMQDVQPPTEVRDAFKDVASAREDKQRLTNEAEAYRSDILPKAQGTATETINKAEAYKETRIKNAEGETTRFLAILEQYNKAEDVTKKRLLLETMEEILSQPGIDKVVLPENMGGQVLPFLPLGPQGSNSQNHTLNVIPQLESQSSSKTSTRPSSRGSN